MDTDRFDALTRTLPAANSRRGTLVAALGGSHAALSLLETGAKKKKKKKKTTPTTCTCPPPTTCPPPDTCPARTCCTCNTTTSPTPGACRYAPHALTVTEQIAVCNAACGGPGTFATAAPSQPGESKACNTAGTGCISVDCPT